MSTADLLQDKPSVNKGGRPKKPVDTTTPEYQAAVRDGVAAALPGMKDEIVKQLAAQLGVARTDAGTAAAVPPSGDKDFVLHLAQSLTDIASQGQNKQQVSLAEIEKRKRARDRMGQLLIEAQARGDQPEYQLVGKIYFDEQLIQPYRNDPAVKGRVIPTQIIWNGAPNEAMRPLNKVAADIFAAYMESVGGSAETIGGQWATDSRPVWVTLGGMVVKGVGSVRRQIANVSEGAEAPRPAPAFGSGLVIKGPEGSDPTAPTVRVLGSVAAPARQNYSDTLR